MRPGDHTGIRPEHGREQSHSRDAPRLDSVERFSTSTAFSVDSPHEKAWRASLRELMESDWQRHP